MIKKFVVPCDFSGQKYPVPLYIGDPEPSHHPLNFQSSWLTDVRGGSIPGEVMDSISRLHELAKANHVSFEELCYYALSAAYGETGAIVASKGEKNAKFDEIIESN